MMPIEIDDLTEDEQMEYWNRLEVFARKSRENLVRLARLSDRLATANVSPAAADEVLTKERVRLDRERGPQLTADDVRRIHTEPVETV